MHHQHPGEMERDSGGGPPTRPPAGDGSHEENALRVMDTVELQDLLEERERSIETLQSASEAQRETMDAIFWELKNVYELLEYKTEEAAELKTELQRLRSFLLRQNNTIRRISGELWRCRDREQQGSDDRDSSSSAEINPYESSNLVTDGVLLEDEYELMERLPSTVSASAIGARTPLSQHTHMVTPSFQRRARQQSDLAALLFPTEVRLLASNRTSPDHPQTPNGTSDEDNDDGDDGSSSLCSTAQDSIVLTKSRSSVRQSTPPPPVGTSLQTTLADALVLATSAGCPFSTQGQHNKQEDQSSWDSRGAEDSTHQEQQDEQSHTQQEQNQIFPSESSDTNSTINQNNGSDEDTDMERVVPKMASLVVVQPSTDIDPSGILRHQPKATTSESLSTHQKLPTPIYVAPDLRFPSSLEEEGVMDSGAGVTGENLPSSRTSPPDAEKGTSSTREIVDRIIPQQQVPHGAAHLSLMTALQLLDEDEQDAP